MLKTINAHKITRINGHKIKIHGHVHPYNILKIALRSRRQSRCCSLCDTAKMLHAGLQHLVSAAGMLAYQCDILGVIGH